MAHISQKLVTIIHLVVVSEDTTHWWHWLRNWNNRGVIWHPPTVRWHSWYISIVCAGASEVTLATFDDAWYSEYTNTTSVTISHLMTQYSEYLVHQGKMWQSQPRWVLGKLCSWETHWVILSIPTTRMLFVAVLSNWIDKHQVILSAQPSVSLVMGNFI